ncbi:MAG: chorismate mutase [Cyanobacteriota bacterium]|nr:chorismate mutase [Cyanobacteriota bacterium]
MGWRVRALRGATTVEANTEAAIAAAVAELLDQMVAENDIDLEEVVNVIFSVTADLNACYPARWARLREGWQYVPLLDVQQMAVPHDLDRCIRVLLQFNTLLPQSQIRHVYLHGARHLRPDLDRQRQAASLPS